MNSDSASTPERQRGSPDKIEARLQIVVEELPGGEAGRRTEARMPDVEEFAEADSTRKCRWRSAGSCVHPIHSGWMCVFAIGWAAPPS
jgi:hypothetical protein